MVHSLVVWAGYLVRFWNQLHVIMKKHNLNGKFGLDFSMPDEVGFFQGWFFGED